ncbi:acyltransferase family protein [Arthrobacter sp. H5]|uniref:acyltransferase family protein n=1 Tax=Arthrobacter sp. H5 TaxID=1267973 RepID=UPI000489FF54|nr:acyltransferase family protein [Arthrobacter sp. H5]
MDRAEFRPDIQGLRALAVLAVVLYHAGVSLLPGGYAGVDVFFVISGFLITTHLLKMLREKGTINFAQFYARRIRRILPASFVVLILTAVASLLFLPRVDTPGALEDATATALYVPNLLFASQGTDYLAETSPSPFQHYWSLGIEEQFYLLWPLVLFGAFLLVRRSSLRLFLVIFALVTCSFAASIFLTAVSQPWAFFSLPSRAWELGVGGLVAFALQYRTIPVGAKLANCGAWLGLVGLAASIVLLNAETPFPGYAALLPVLSTALLILCGKTSAASRLLLTARPLQAVGKWSYSIYLIHWPLLVIPQVAVGTENTLPLTVTFGLAALSIPLAALLHRFVEEPLRRPRRSTGRPARSVPVVAAAVAASLLFAGAASATESAVGNSPIASGQEAKRLAGNPNPSGTPVVPSNVTPDLRSAPDSLPATNTDGCHSEQEERAVSAGCVYGDEGAETDVVLFGDSHAAQWFPGVEKFADSDSHRLHNITKSSCPSVSIDIERNGAPYTECDEWRASALDTIRELAPELIVISNYGRVNPVDKSADTNKQWEAGLKATLEALPEESKVVIIADTPHHPAPPVSCLSRNVEQAIKCDVNKADALDPALAEAERRTALTADAEYIDLTEYMCTDTCPSIIGDILVYRDAHHITETFSQALAPRLSEKLEKIL